MKKGSGEGKEPLPPSWAVSQSPLCWTGVNYKEELSKSSLELLTSGKYGIKAIGNQKWLMQNGWIKTKGWRDATGSKVSPEAKNGRLALSEFLLKRREMIMERKRDERRRLNLNTPLALKSDASQASSLPNTSLTPLASQPTQEAATPAHKKRKQGKKKESSSTPSMLPIQPIWGWNDLPQEVCIRILMLLDIKSLFSANKISKRERSLLDEHNHIWKTVAVRQWNLFVQEIGYYGSVRERCSRFSDPDISSSTPSDAMVHIASDRRLWQETILPGSWPQYAASLLFLMERTKFSLPSFSTPSNLPSSSITSRVLSARENHLLESEEEVKVKTAPLARSNGASSAISLRNSASMAPPVDFEDRELDKRLSRSEKRTSVMGTPSSSRSLPLASSSSSSSLGHQSTSKSSLSAMLQRMKMAAKEESLPNGRGVKIDVIERVLIGYDTKTGSSAIISPRSTNHKERKSNRQNTSARDDPYEYRHYLLGSVVAKVCLDSPSDLMEVERNEELDWNSSMPSSISSEEFGQAKQNSSYWRPIPLIFGWNDPELEEYIANNEEGNREQDLDRVEERAAIGTGRGVRRRNGGEMAQDHHREEGNQGGVDQTGGEGGGGDPTANARRRTIDIEDQVRDEVIRRERAIARRAMDYDLADNDEDFSDDEELANDALFTQRAMERIRRREGAGGGIAHGNGNANITGGARAANVDHNEDHDQGMAADDGEDNEDIHPSHPLLLLNRTISTYRRLNKTLPMLLWQLPLNTRRETCAILRDLYFHPCVNLPLFASSRAVTSIPPLFTPFHLARYRLHSEEDSSQHASSIFAPRSFAPPILLNARIFRKGDPIHSESKEKGSPKVSKMTPSSSSKTQIPSSISSSSSSPSPSLSPPSKSKSKKASHHQPAEASPPSILASPKSRPSSKTKFQCRLDIWASPQFSFSSATISVPIPFQPRKVIVSHGSHKIISLKEENERASKLQEGKSSKHSSPPSPSPSRPSSPPPTLSPELVLEWKLPKRISGFCSLVASFTISSPEEHGMDPSWQPEELSSQPIAMRYTIENGSLSNFKIRYVMQLKSTAPDTPYQPLPCTIRHVIVGEQLYRRWPEEFEMKA